LFFEPLLPGENINPSPCFKASAIIPERTECTKKENIEQLQLPDVFRRGEKIFLLFPFISAEIHLQL